MNSKLTTFKKASDCKKIDEVTDVDLGTYVKEAMKNVFGEQSLNSDLFAAVKDFAGTNTNSNNIPITAHDGVSGIQRNAPIRHLMKPQKRNIFH